MKNYYISRLIYICPFLMNNQSWQKPFKTKDELKEWCKDNQPYYKKHIPDVVNYFLSKL